MSAHATATDVISDSQIRADGTHLAINPSLPPPRSWPVRSELASVVYPNTPRYYVQRWESVKVSWISPNCAAPGMPEPPTEHGPRACGCPGRRGFAETVYGHMENERLWACCADWYDEDKPEKAFAPDIWRGYGPCPAMNYVSVLHQFPAYVKDSRTAHTWFRIEESARRDMEAVESLDADVLPWLFPDDAPRRPPNVPRLVFEGAPSVEVLHARWAVWALYIGRKRAYVSHEMVASNAARAALAGNATGFDRMKRAYYFGYTAVGAWFDRTPEQVGVIRHFISLGVPVYYRWELNYADKQKLADLRPSQGPDEELVLYSPPSNPPPRAPQPLRASPTPASVGPTALSSPPPDLELHWNSVRRASSEALDEYGYSIEDDEDALEMLEQHEAESAASPVARSSPAPSTAPSQATSLSSAAPPPSATPPAINPVVAKPSLTQSDISWAHGVAAHASRVPIQRRLSLVVPGVAWFPIPNVLDYFRQKDEYKLDDRGKHLEGRMYSEGVDWHARMLAPYWLPEPFKARMNSRVQNQLEQVEMAFRYGVGFQTIIPDWVPPPVLEPSPVEGYGFREAYLRAHSHAVVDELNLVDGKPVGEFVQNWAVWISAFCQRPHARAALGAGGLPARLARWGGLSLNDALAGPSEGVRNWGTSHPIEELVAGRTVVGMDDWLEPPEVLALYGFLHRPGGKVLSLWPDPDQFRRNWFNERGTWTLAMEVWFVKRLEELWNGRKKPDLKTRKQWREDIRENKREEDAALAKNG